MYEEVIEKGKPGRRAAAPNVSVQIALHRHGISNTGFQDILMAANISPPSLAGLQKAANAINPKLVKENKKDMSDIMQNLKKTNVKMGLPAEAPINVESDCTYNNSLRSGGGRTPYQPGTTVDDRNGVSERE